MSSLAPRTTYGSRPRERGACRIQSRNRLIVAAAAAAIIASASTPAEAAYVNKLADWVKFDQAGKEAYLLGVADQAEATWALILKADSDSIDAVVIGRQQCLIDNGLSAGFLVKLVDDAYASDPAKWPLSPDTVLMSALAKMCRPQINHERIRRGLPAIK